MASEYVVAAVALVVALVAVAVAVSGFSYLLWLVLRVFSAPGVVVHEFAHKQACDAAGVPVAEVVYFRLGDPPGYVRHHHPKRYRTSFLISVAPFLVNTIISLVAFLGFAWLVTTTVDVASVSAAVADLRVAPPETLALVGLSGWLGLSVGMQAFPSTGDAKTLWTRSSSEWRQSPLVLLGVPVVVVIYVANLLSWLWADVLYALALGVAAFSVVGWIGL
ncbi:Putative zincin peptidase [Natronorubrum sediminis]|uniref:Putative zincin peptidase n=1 Tax=Natronorubrum sediminis TaxID=640943 RepID=A0A1H6FQL4_9EURY|nr:metalloprotease family protein [Natronorubrum sediminis]SEH13186.1 Putative zincin peptidase [Natronorubrum sediminis]